MGNILGRLGLHWLPVLAINRLLRNGSADIHIFQDYALSMPRCFTSHRKQHFQVRISTCDFPLSGILHGATVFIHY